MKNIANYLEDFIDDEIESSKHQQSGKKIKKMKDFMADDKHNPKLKNRKKYK